MNCLDRAQIPFRSSFLRPPEFRQSILNDATSQRVDPFVLVDSSTLLPSAVNEHCFFDWKIRQRVLSLHLILSEILTILITDNLSQTLSKQHAHVIRLVESKVFLELEGFNALEETRHIHRLCCGKNQDNFVLLSAVVRNVGIDVNVDVVWRKNFSVRARRLAVDLMSMLDDIDFDWKLKAQG